MELILCIHLLKAADAAVIIVNGAFEEFGGHDAERY